MSDEAEDEDESQRKKTIRDDSESEGDLEEQQEEKLTCNKCKARLQNLAETFNRTFSGNLVAYERDHSAKQA